MELTIIIFRKIGIKKIRWLIHSVEPGQTVRMCMLAWLYTDGKDLSLSAGLGILCNLFKYIDFMQIKLFTKIKKYLNLSA